MGDDKHGDGNQPQSGKPEQAHDRSLGGIRCLEVLGHLDTFVEGSLAPATRTKIEAHLHGCDWCERFGGSYVKLIKEIKATQTKATQSPVTPPMPSLADQLATRLDELDRQREES